MEQTGTTTRRIRAGLYEITTATGTIWTVEERQADQAWGGSWEWFATSDDGGNLDPMPRLRDVRMAVGHP